PFSSSPDTTAPHSFPTRRSSDLVETAVILVSYINKLRLEGRTIREATLDASLLRLRPIMMTALVACLGLLPAALSTGVGSDTQKDRKSTRLNSSHLVISYAVFCL